MLSMPKLKESAKIGGTLAGMAASNILLVKAVQSGALSVPMAGVGLSVGWPIIGLVVARKNPKLGATIAGASLGATLSALAAYFTGDFSLIASNPKTARQFQSYNKSEMAGLPENLFYMHTGK